MSMFRRIVAVLVVSIIPFGISACKSKRDNTSQSVGISDETDKAAIEVAKENIITYEDGDRVYIPEKKDLVYDNTECVRYFDNLIGVYLWTDVDETVINDLADLVQGEVVGHVSGSCNYLQIAVPHSDISTIKEYSETLMNNENVLYASYESPVTISSCTDDNPWSEDGTVIPDKGNEQSPYGNDWWAEAIGMYTTWEIVDNCKLADIKIGIIDTGFDFQHEDINPDGTRKIAMMPKYPANTVDDHGTSVLSIISAADNDKGFRGVADKASVVCVDRSSGTDYFSNGEYLTIMKDLIDNDCKVINNSWCFIPQTKSAWSDDKDKVETTYDEYIKRVANEAKQDSARCLVMLIQAIRNKKEFIIVEGAGNGYSNSSWGYDSRFSGFFCGIDESLYNEFRDSAPSAVRKKMDELEIDYRLVKSHIMIVAAVDMPDNQGVYKMKASNGGTEWGSCYGPRVDICAPGNKILCATTLKDDLTQQHNSSSKGKLYEISGGTSLAAPIVSGSLALLWQIDPSLTASEVKDLLIDKDTSGVAVGVEGGAGTEYRMLNIGKAVIELTGVSPFNPDSVIVSDANVSFDTYDMFGNGSNVEIICYHTPQIQIDDVNTDAVNQKMYEEIATNSNYYHGIHYTYGIHGSIISIFVEKDDWDGHNFDFNIYNISGLTGELVTDDELLSAYGMTREEFDNLVLQKYQQGVKDGFRNNWLGVNADGISDETVSSANIHAARPFTNSNGNLSFLGEVYVFGGDGGQDFILNTSDTEPLVSDYVTCPIDHSGDVVLPTPAPSPTPTQPETSDELAAIITSIYGFYNGLYGSSDWIVISEHEIWQTDAGYSLIVRSTGGSEANVLFTGIEANTSTGEMSDDFGNTWNYHDYS